MGEPVERKDNIMTSLSRQMLAFVNRVQSLPPGIHTIKVVKGSAGSHGLLGWAVEEGPTLERVKERK